MVAFSLFVFTVGVSCITVWMEIDASRQALRGEHASRDDDLGGGFDGSFD